MELSNAIIKKIQEGTTQAQVIKKKTFRKNFFYFGKWNFLASSLKENFLIFQEGICKT